MPLKTIQRKKVYLEAMTQIRDAIIAGEYKIGDKLPSEHELMGIFQISRASVREATSGLNALGLIDSKPGGGYFVKSNNSFATMELLLVEDGNPLEIIEARKMIEPMIVQVAAQRREQKDLEDLDRIMASAEQFFTGKNDQSLDDYLNTDNELHRVFARSTYNDILISIQEQLIGYMKQSSWDILKRKVDSKPEIVRRYWTEHMAICDSIRQNLPLKAFEHMSMHIQGIKKDLLREVNDRETVPENEFGDDGSE